MRKCTTIVQELIVDLKKLREKGIRDNLREEMAESFDAPAVFTGNVHEE